MSVAHATHFIRQAALGLQHAHECGMVHRDIKPANLMLTSAGVVKIMDFGLARLAREGAINGGLTGKHMLMGTADYIAPEQADDAQTADIRADIYSLGCTFYHLLAARPPFAGGTVMQTLLAHTTTPPPLAELPEGTPEALRAVLAMMLEKNPAKRYQTPDEGVKALRACRKNPTRVGLPTVKRKDRGTLLPDRGTRIDPPVGPAVSHPSEVADDADARESNRPTRSVGQPRARRAKRKRRSTRWALAFSAGLAVALFAGLVAFGVSRLRDPKADQSPLGKGEVVVRCKDHRLELAIRREGKVVETIRPDSPALSLPTGEYDLQVVAGAPELVGFEGKLSLAEGARLVVDVRREGIIVQDAASARPPPWQPNDRPPFQRKLGDK